VEGPVSSPARILVANRGEIAHRLLAFYRSIGVETVAAFSEPDAEGSWLEEADYDAFLAGRTAEETYLDPQKVVSAAMDAGCDAVHPGYCFLAERIDLYDIATRANMGVIGTDPERVLDIVDRIRLLDRARRLGIPVIPASAPISVQDDGIEQAARLSLPLFVKAAHGGALRRVEAFDDLPVALAAVRDEARRTTGDDTVYLERAVGAVRRVATVVVGDRHGTLVHLGTTDGSLEWRFRSWAEEAGSGVAPGQADVLGEMALELARDVGWVGVGSVRWVITPDGEPWLLGFSARLTTGFDLVEAIQGVDLVQAQHLAVTGERLGWRQPKPVTDRHGIQLRLLHLDPTDDSRPDGVLEALELPASDCTVSVGADEGQACTEHTDPLIAKITVVGADRADAVERARQALGAIRVEGIATNLEALRDVVGSPEWASDAFDVRTLAVRR
jgi:acetyl-CoA carboxylase biotin carboxylase subunit